MTLAVGTTLQHGTYVIDAWVTEDAIGPVYLAMHVPTGQWMQLRVLGSRRPDQLPDLGDRQRFYQYLEQVNELGNPAFPARLGGFEEEGVCYQTLACPQGNSLDQLVTPAAPWPPRRSLAIVHQLIDLLEILRPLGWAGLGLTPDQIWCDQNEQGLQFVGFDLVAPQFTISPSTIAEGESAISPEEVALVQGLSRLLYFLLTGQRAETTHAPLAIDVRRRYPSLPTSLDQALDAGTFGGQSALGSTPAVSLSEWKALMPAIADLPPDPPPAPKPPTPATPATLVASPTGTFNGSRPVTRPFGSQPDSRSLPPLTAPAQRSMPAVALVLTGLVATVTGLGLGLYTRLQPANSAGQERLNPDQSFPPLTDWSSDTLWQPWDDAPALRNRPNYGSTPPPSSPPPNHLPDPREPAAPPPAVVRPEIAQPEPLPAPTDNGELPTEPGFQPELTPQFPSTPDPTLAPEVAPPPAPIPAPAPLEAPPPSQPPEGNAPAPLTAPPRPVAPAPAPN